MIVIKRNEIVRMTRSNKTVNTLNLCFVIFPLNELQVTKLMTSVSKLLPFGFYLLAFTFRHLTLSLYKCRANEKTYAIAATVVYPYSY